MFDTGVLGAPVNLKMKDNDPLYWLISEAIQQLGLDADPKKLADRIRRLQVGLPAEDEFSVLLTWLGRCRLVHKLDQLQSPKSSRNTWAVPDLLAVFDYLGHDVAVLIEVKTTPFSNNRLSWRPAYRDAMIRYADLLGLPLLVAWRFGNIWTLFDARLLTPSPSRHKIDFTEAIRHTLMAELAGDFSFSLRPGCGMHLRIRKLRETATGFHGRIDEAYWLNADGKRFTKAPGVFPLFLCLDQESIVTEEDDHVIQSFVVPDAQAAEFAHRALAALLRFSTRKDDIHWRRTLESHMPSPVADGGLRHAADDALRCGFLRYGLLIQPATIPDFLLGYKRAARN